MAIGIGEDYPKGTRTLAAARRDLEVLKTNGLKVLRISFAWDAMEPERGRYDWSFWDEYVRMATQEYGMSLIPYVCYTPRWASSTEQGFWRQPPKENAFFAEFMKELVARYKHRIHSWEIWNEPDNPDYWRGSVQDFANLLRSGSRAVRETDSKAQIVMGGLAWNLSFLDAMLTNEAAIQNINVFNLHSYYETWSSEPVERISDYLARAHEILAAHHRQSPLWMAEAGYSSFRRGHLVSSQSQAVYSYEHTPEYQAATLFRILTVALASGEVCLVTWYRINDLPAGQEVIGDQNNRYLGILDNTGHPKPALQALRYSESLFGHGFRCCDDQVRVERSIASAAEAHAFLLPDKRLILVGWLRNERRGRGSDHNNDSEKNRLERVVLWLPFQTARSGQIHDALGIRIHPLAATRSRNGSRFSLDLTDGQVQVAVLETSFRR